MDVVFCIAFYYIANPLNYIFNVGGTDFLSAVRAALGLA